MNNNFKHLVRSSSIILLLLVIALQGLPAACAGPAQQGGDTTAFVNVNLIPMDSERVLANQTVLVQGDRIIEIGPVDADTVPSGAQVIAGEGAYLMPGLADMHTHLLENKDAMILYLANGVTTIRNFSTLPLILTWRDQIAAGELLGPTIRPGKSFWGAPPVDTDFLVYRFNRAGGPFFSFYPPVLAFVADTAEGRQQVLQAKADGYEFIKINYGFSRETFDSMVTTAAEVGLPVRGHVPAAAGIEHMVRSGAEIQHSYSLMAYVAKDYVRRPGPNALDRFDLSEEAEKLPELVALMAENGVDFTPTLVTDIISRMLDDAQGVIQQQPAYRYVPPSFMRTWRNPLANPEVRQVLESGQLPERASRDESQAYYKRQVKALHDGGVRILVGTDANVLGVIWGFAVSEELELFVEAGLTPYQALEAATRLPAEVFGNPEEWGTVEAGKRADLLLLQANPLADISHIRQIVGVMARGRWLPQAELQGMLDEIAAKYQVQEAQMAQRDQQAQEAQQAQIEAPIELEPFSGPYFSGLTPAGWNELEPGTYARSNPKVDPTLLFQLAAPSAEAEGLLGSLLADFGVAELPEPIDDYQSAALSWNLYMLKSQMAPLALALAETDEVAYIVLLAAPPDQMDALAEAVFLPAVDALTPIE